MKAIKPGKIYTRTRQEIDKKREAAKNKRGELESRLKETIERIESTKAQKNAAREQYDLDRLNDLLNTEKALINDKSTLEVFIQDTSKILTDEESTAAKRNLAAEYNDLLTEYGRIFEEKLQELEELQNTFNQTMALYNTLDKDIKKASGENGRGTFTTDHKYSPYWNEGVFMNVQRIRNLIVNRKKLTA